LLEVGCATGKATRPLLERGFPVVCVELGPRPADRARASLAGLRVQVQVAPFEAWDGEAGAFDLVYAATAWHWVDPAIRYRQAHRLLQPGGHLAIWGAQHAFPAGFDPFFTEIQAVYESLGMGREAAWPPPPPERVPDDRTEIEGSRLFDHVEVRRYVWETSYTADGYLALLDTFSSHIAMDPRDREHLDAEIRRRIEGRPDGRVRRHWHAILHVARRAPRLA
jgi:SAM-dependent methyltransferase